MASPHVLVTGPPRVGKSTLIERVLRRLEQPVTGFFTREIRRQGRRQGFSIRTCDGKTGTLAHEDSKSRVRVGKYGVEIGDLERLAVPSMIPGSSEEVVVVDEIGKMECFSPAFRRTVLHVLDLPNAVIGSIALRGDRFIEEIKKRPDVELVLVSEQNRDALVEKLVERFRGAYGSFEKNRGT